jgi:hypothetical protein
MPRVGFEPTIPAFDQAKTVHALDRVATVIGFRLIWHSDNVVDSYLVGAWFESGLRFSLVPPGKC